MIPRTAKDGVKGQPTGRRVDTFAHRVRWAHQHNTKLSKAQAAKALGISVFRLADIENGRETNVPKILLDRLAVTFKTTGDWLKYGTERSAYFAIKTDKAETDKAVAEELGVDSIPEQPDIIEPVTPPAPPVEAPIEVPVAPPAAPAAPVVAAKPAAMPEFDLTTLAGRLRAARSVIPNYTLSMLANATDLSLKHLQR